MFNLFELMKQAQGGSPAEAFARQFGLSPPQAESAIDALLPAFALALQRQLQDPAQWPKLFQAFAVAQQTTMMEAAAKAFAPQATAAPDLAGMLFGSNDIARQIAQQAAAYSGLSPVILQQMMGPMGATLMTGLAQAMTQQGLAPWLSALGGQATQAAANPFAAFTTMMGQMMGAAAQAGAAKPQAEPPRPASDYLDPQAMGAFINQMLGGKTPEPPPPEEPPPPPPTATDLGLDAMSQIVETGREVQEQHLQTMQAILQQMFPADKGQPGGR
ncbi:DUF937 domain-containing protein [uncultured Alsobacter sp.]|uniref:DUF937 domain-containing protein n=1 Tax=uncultured Alsobacter sp. TaxID=1748258 RepID=UPI0025E20FFD|nr:DUF937 domain-containing protein [uncultured Alsobacter sp.]